MRPMDFPAKLRGLKWLAAVVGLYGFIWIGLEGAIWQALLLAVGLVLSGELYLLERQLGGRHISGRRWLLYCALLGCFSGLACAILALALMAIKTGLHGHGPEFSAAEIEWLLAQIPLWMVSAMIAALGLGTLAMAFQRR
jgi:hypothetical protein